MFCWIELAAMVLMATGDRSAQVRAAYGDFAGLIGNWKGTVTPLDAASRRNRAFSRENAAFEWKFADAAEIVWTINEGKFLRGGSLTYDPKSRLYGCVLRLADDSEVHLHGKRDGARIDFSTDEQAAVGWRLVLTHPNINRINYSLYRRTADSGRFLPVAEGGYTRAGVQFAAGGGGPECIVTGGAGVMEVVYAGKTYYVCCAGCKEAFNAEPEKYIAEAKAKRSKR